MTSDPLSPSEFTEIVRRVESGDQEASAELWNHCYPRLLNYCRAKLPEHLRRVLDEEDVALSAFKSYCLGAVKGRTGTVNSRDEFWRYLFCIAGRKAQGYIRHQTREKRGGGRVRGESVFDAGDARQSEVGIEQCAGNAESPAMLAQFTDDCQRLFDLLDDDRLRAIALLRVEGHSVDEIGQRIGCAKRSVERRLKLIRMTWETAIQDRSSE